MNVQFGGNVRIAINYLYTDYVDRRTQGNSYETYRVKISADNAGAREKSIKLIMHHKASAYEYIETLLDIGGTRLDIGGTRLDRQSGGGRTLCRTGGLVII